MASEFTTADGVTLSIAILGAVLGILNTWKSIDKDRVKIKVVPKMAVPVGTKISGQSTLAIDVTNLSTFPVVISEVGVLYHGTKNRGAVIRPIIIDGGAFPRKLDPRTSFTAYTQPNVLENTHGHMVKCAYASTDCGLMVKGNSPALKQMVLDLYANQALNSDG